MVKTLVNFQVYRSLCNFLHLLHRPKRYLGGQCCNPVVRSFYETEVKNIYYRRKWLLSFLMSLAKIFLFGTQNIF